MDNYVDTKAKCCHVKILTCRGTFRQASIRVYRLMIHSVMLVALWTVASLPFSLVQLSPQPPSLSMLYTRIQYRVWRGYWVLGLGQINTGCKVPLQVNFFRWVTVYFVVYLITVISQSVQCFDIVALTRVRWPETRGSAPGCRFTTETFSKGTQTSLYK